MRLRPWTGILVLILCLSLLLPAPSARAIDKEAALSAGAMWVGGLTAGAIFAYFAWLNRPGEQQYMDWTPRGPGGFFFSAFTGVSLVQSSPYNLKRKFFFDNIDRPVTTSPIGYTPGVVGGLKFGYFFHSRPRLGFELEGNFTTHDPHPHQVTFRPALQGFNTGTLQRQRLYVMTWAAHLLYRYGFWPDKEVNFGRLQPYVGVGPGFVVIYGFLDSAKNFSLETLAGVRYMVRPHLSLYTEYKFSMQWGAELDSTSLTFPNGTKQTGTAAFDWPDHKLVFGVAFHFL